MAIHALLVNDDEDVLQLAKGCLERSGKILLDVANSVAVAESMMEAKRYDAIISEYDMPVTNGLEFLIKLRDVGNQTPFILFAKKGEEASIIEALEKGADFYIQKSGNLKNQCVDVEHKIVQTVRKYNCDNELRRSVRALGSIEGVSLSGTWTLHTDSMRFEAKHYDSSEDDHDPRGKDPIDPPRSVEELSSHMHPDDRQKISDFIRDITLIGKTRDVDYRLVGRDGSIHYIRAIADEIVKGEDGRVILASGITLDLTKRRAMKESSKGA